MNLNKIRTRLPVELLLNSLYFPATITKGFFLRSYPVYPRRCRLTHHADNNLLIRLWNKSQLESTVFGTHLIYISVLDSGCWFGLTKERPTDTGEGSKGGPMLSRSEVKGLTDDPQLGNPFHPMTHIYMPLLLFGGRERYKFNWNLGWHSIFSIKHVPLQSIDVRKCNLLAYKFQ